jgi:hypothetical protein
VAASVTAERGTEPFEKRGTVAAFEVERGAVDQLEVVAAYTVEHVDWSRS